MAGRVSQYRSVTAARVEQRGEQRHRVLVTQAVVRQPGIAPAEAALADLSVYGCRLACTAEHAEGDAIWLNFPQGDPVPASVVWSDGAHIGCRFDAPIAQNMVRALTLVIC